MEITDVGKFSSPTRPQVHLVGVEIEQLPGGDLLAISLQEDVTVFYGLNGAGKSTVLRSVESALTGLRGELEVTLYLQFIELDATVALTSRLDAQAPRVARPRR